MRPPAPRTTSSTPEATTPTPRTHPACKRSKTHPAESHESTAPRAANGKDSWEAGSDQFRSDSCLGDQTSDPYTAREQLRPRQADPRTLPGDGPHNAGGNMFRGKKSVGAMRALV